MELQRFLGISVPTVYSTSDYIISAFDVPIPLASDFLSIPPNAPTIPQRPENIKRQLEKEYTALQELHSKITHHISRLQVEDIFFQKQLQQLEAQLMQRNKDGEESVQSKEPEEMSIESAPTPRPIKRESESETESMEDNEKPSETNLANKNNSDSNQKELELENLDLNIQQLENIDENSQQLENIDENPQQLENIDENPQQLENIDENSQLENISLLKPSGSISLEKELEALGEIEKAQNQIWSQLKPQDDDSSVDDEDDLAQQEMSQILMREYGSDFKNV